MYFLFFVLERLELAEFGLFMQNDAKALHELDTALRQLDANDPVKYDFALFGLGVFEKF